MIRNGLGRQIRSLAHVSTISGIVSDAKYDFIFYFLFFIFIFILFLASDYS